MTKYYEPYEATRQTEFEPGEPTELPLYLRLGTEMPNPDRRVTRRQLFVGASVVLAAGFIAGKNFSKHEINEQADPSPNHVAETDSTTESPTSESTPIEHDYLSDPIPEAPFNPNSADANRIAADLGIKTQDYFLPGDDGLNVVLERIDPKDLSGELLPLFPPAVMQYSELLEEVAQEYGVPVNLLAGIVTIESAGEKDAISKDKGFGLTQITLPYQWENIVAEAQKQGKFLPFEDAFGNTISPSLGELGTFFGEENTEAGGMAWGTFESYKNALLDPEINLRAGAKYLRECLEATCSNPDTPAATEIARAAACYNGGIDEATKPVDDMPGYSIAYMRYIERQMLDVAIAARLRNEGYPDREILDAMQPSTELNAMMYAFGDAYNAQKKVTDNGAQRETMERFAGASTGGDLGIVGGAATNYERYMRGSEQNPTLPYADNYTSPLPPSIRFWFANGGRALLNSVEMNRNW